jgi:hypothetical protein
MAVNQFIQWNFCSNDHYKYINYFCYTIVLMKPAVILVFFFGHESPKLRPPFCYKAPKSRLIESSPEKE